MSSDRLTPGQFAALAQLLRMQPASATREAARLVLVEGISGAEAGRQLGITPSAVAQALAGCRKGLELARVAAGQDAATAKL